MEATQELSLHLNLELTAVRAMPRTELISLGMKEVARQMAFTSADAMYEMQANIEYFDYQLRRAVGGMGTNNARTLRATRAKHVEALKRQLQLYTSVLQNADIPVSLVADVTLVAPVTTDGIQLVLDVLEPMIGLRQDHITRMLPAERVAVRQLVRETQRHKRAIEEFGHISKDLHHAASYYHKQLLHATTVARSLIRAIEAVEAGIDQVAGEAVAAGTGEVAGDDESEGGSLVLRLVQDLVAAVDQTAYRLARPAVHLSTAEFLTFARGIFRYVTDYIREIAHRREHLRRALDSATVTQHHPYFHVDDSLTGEVDLSSFGVEAAVDMTFADWSDADFEDDRSDGADGEQNDEMEDVAAGNAD